MDADRARRESRDGPLSAGSSSSDPPYSSQAYRGGFGRGRATSVRGRGDWDRGRGRGGYYDERDHRSARSRSQEGHWGRERDDRDHRYPESDARSRDPRDDRDSRGRELVRPKLDRGSLSHEPSPSLKDVSPPPLAPSAPAFGSVPSRHPSSADILSLTGKVPPTGPRALTEERPVSAGHQGVLSDRPPPTGPSKPSLADVSPLIPIGPRAQQQKQQRPSSKQWINPSLAVKKTPESPKVNRSQSFVSHQPRPFGVRLESSSSDLHGDFDRRPRSSDAKAESLIESADGRFRPLHIAEPGEIRGQRETQSARASVDRDTREPFSSYGPRRGLFDAARTNGDATSPTPSYQTASPSLSKPDHPEEASEKSHFWRAANASLARPGSSVEITVLEVPGSPTAAPEDDHSSESDEDIDDNYFDDEIAKAEAELKRLEADADFLPEESFIRVGLVSAIQAETLLINGVQLSEVLGPIPEGVKAPWDISGESAPVESAPDAMEITMEPVSAVPESTVAPEKVDVVSTTEAEPQRNMEEMDVDGPHGPHDTLDAHDAHGPHTPIPTVERDDHRTEDGDVVMNDATEVAERSMEPHPQPSLTNGDYDGESLEFPPAFEPTTSRRTTPSQVEDDDATEVEDVLDLATLKAVRNYMKTPPIDELPEYKCTPWDQNKQFLRSLSPSSSLSEFIIGGIAAETVCKLEEQDKVRQSYGEHYNIYLRFTTSDDPVALKSRERFSGGPPPPEIAATVVTGQEPKPEGRRTGRFATERDLERVLQASMREEDERKERELRAQKEKFRSEKEAVIPIQYWTEEDRNRDLLMDTSGYLPPEKLVAAWQILPPVINFTEEEAEQFEKAYLEFPKQWGRIADRLPKRDFHACIQYYYGRKRELNLKEKLKKQPRRRKKGSRGKQRSSALVSELGNGENEGEETTENGENGERRRPRRAAAPTWNFEAATAADSDGTTPAGTPGRRRGGDAAVKNDSGAEKPEGKKRGKRGAREREPKQVKPTQTLAPAPPGGKPNRSRSNSRAQGPEWQSPQGQADVGRMPTQFEIPQIQPPIVAPQARVSPERAIPAAASSLSEVMAPPSLRPEPPPPQATVTIFESGPERARANPQASSYWSVSEINDFPALLRSFGTDWQAIAAHMQTKTAVMVRLFLGGPRREVVSDSCANNGFRRRRIFSPGRRKAPKLSGNRLWPRLMQNGPEETLCQHLLR